MHGSVKGRWRRWILFGLTLVVIITVVAWFVLLRPLPAQLGQSDLASTDQVRVDKAEPQTFAPVADPAPTTGLILYTGARVPPQAYAPVARRIADAGYLVVVPKLPLNFAILDPDAADAVIAATPEVDRWVLAGHSLGGAMAARYAPPQIDGLVLWAAWPEDAQDRSDDDIVVASIYGTTDCVATPEEVREATPRLPPDTRFVPVEGGNHAQFGSYGPQRGDCPATVEPAQQWDQVAEATVAVLDAVSE